MKTELEGQYGKKDWNITFRAGPDAIGILAECILITSRPNVIGLEVTGDGLKYTALSTNVIHCAEVGNETFRETAEKMEQLAGLTHGLSRSGGTIDEMLEFSEPGQSECRDSVLADLVARGQEDITLCMNAIEDVNTSFNGWCNLTRALHLALRDTHSLKSREKQNITNDIKKHRADKEMKEELRKKEEARMKEKHEQIQKTQANEEWCEDIIQKIIMHAGAHGVSAAVVSAEAITIAPVFVVVSAAAFLYYVTLRADLESMEQAQAKRDQEIQELEESRAQLEAALAQLSEDSRSIDEIAQIVERSIDRVTKLQQLIRKFMEFLRDMNIIISKTVRDSRWVYKGFQRKDGFGDSKKLLTNAFEMKTRLIFASKASDVYNAVSTQYILPMLDILPELSCLNQAADHEIQAKIGEMHKLRCRVSSEADVLTRKMHKELKESLDEVTRNTARAFEELVPEDQDATP
ncbi:hypothetical protein BJX99DRAFT_261649 [Aspergillus californicus]